MLAGTSPPDGLPEGAWAQVERFLPEAPSCSVFLEERGATFAAVPDLSAGESCGYSDAVKLEATGINYIGEVVLRCEAAEALVAWERRVVVPQAEELLSSPLAAMQTYGSYTCRNVAGTERRSRHATANAIDVGAFLLEDGTRIDVDDDYYDDTPAGRFLRRVFEGSCDLFDSSLGPDYNRAHENHFHLEIGPYSICE